VRAEQAVFDVVKTMVERNIGAVPVLRDDELVGIFSERDLMKRVVAEGRDAHKTKVSEVMTGNLVTVSPTTSLEHCMDLMRSHGFRHLPVCEGKKLTGLISLRDILLHDLVEKDGEVRAMRAYLTQNS
jgi:CBS domain-containing protein